MCGIFGIVDPKGKWNNIFKNNNPIILELACGKGEYTCEMAIADPARNYIGIKEQAVLRTKRLIRNILQRHTIMDTNCRRCR